MALLHPNKEEFENLLKEKELLVVDFFATWSGPCKMLSPIIEQLSEKYDEGVRVAKIDVDENEELAVKYEIQAVPTIIFFKEGTEIGRVTGIVSLSNLQELVEKHK